MTAEREAALRNDPECKRDCQCITASLLRELDATRSALDSSEQTIPTGWLYRVVVNKHVTGPHEGQYDLGGVWGDKSDHWHFSIEEPMDWSIYEKKPVFDRTPRRASCGRDCGSD